MNGFRFLALALAACAALSGCVAETVRRNPPRRGPVAAVGYVDSGGGEVRYSIEGWSWFVAGRRRDALRRMRKICRPLKPLIVDEATRQDADVSYSQEDLDVNMDRGIEHFTVAPYVHYVFECVRPAGAGAPAPLPAAPVVLPAHPLVEVFAPTLSTPTVAVPAAVDVSSPAAHPEPHQEKSP